MNVSVKLRIKTEFRIRFILFVFLIAFTTRAIAGFSSNAPGDELTKVLLFSGKNNHDWEKTTPVLVRMLRDSKLFTVVVTNRPDSLTYNELKKYQLVISNWTSFPDAKARMSSQWENDYLRYVTEGGGVLSFHAGACSFYDWEPYHKIGIGRWAKETWHGIPTTGRVYGLDQNHPITKGIATFYILDEIWERCDITPEATPIGSISSIDVKDGHPVNFPTAFVNTVVKGKCFYTTLGHDERSLQNSGLQTLLLRAAQWCTGKEVTYPIPNDIKVHVNSSKDQFSWQKTDTTLSLKNRSEIVWQFNYNNRFGKPYFHPLVLNNSDLTCESPPDHPWHLGLWFSWKFINKVNYWEYLKDFSTPETGYRSEGMTAIQKIRIVSNPDFSSDIRLNLLYYPVDGKPVLSEERRLHLSKPLEDGSYSIDEDHLFKALADTVLLDRTPISGEPGGQSWGGYAGLSVRFSQDYTSPQLISPADSAGLRKGNWLFMGLSTLSAEKTGILIISHPQFTPNSTSWYVIKYPPIPFTYLGSTFNYFSPAALFDHNIALKKEETLRLKYQIWILPGLYPKEKLQEKYDQYLRIQ